MHDEIQWCLQEFLLAGGEDGLANHLERHRIGDDLGDAVSVKLRDLLRRRTRTQRNVSYALLSVPLYLAGQLDRLLHEYLRRR